MTHETASSRPVYLSTNSLNYHVTRVSFRVSQALGLGVAMGDRWLRFSGGGEDGDIAITSTTRAGNVTAEVAALRGGRDDLLDQVPVAWS